MKLSTAAYETIENNYIHILQHKQYSVIKNRKQIVTICLHLLSVLKTINPPVHYCVIENGQQRMKFRKCLKC